MDSPDLECVRQREELCFGVYSGALRLRSQERVTDFYGVRQFSAPLMRASCRPVPEFDVTEVRRPHDSTGAAVDRGERHRGPSCLVAQRRLDVFAGLRFANGS